MMISAASIQEAVGAQFDIHVYNTVSSTNTVLREMGLCGAREGTTVIARAQTAGKGRMGRSFFSPSDSGLYMSLLLRPTLQNSLLITAAAAVAAAEAVDALTGEFARIKWVNDIFLHGKKVCGILAEGVFDAVAHENDFIVLGIGINLKTPQTGFPSEIENIAGAVNCDNPNALAVSFMCAFWRYYQELGEKAYLPKYKERSFLDGHNIEVLRGNTARAAQVLGIDDDFHLLVRYDDGATEALSSGEVKINYR